MTTSNAQAAGVGHVLASGAVALDTDTRGVDVQWSENATADSFGKNLVFRPVREPLCNKRFQPARGGDAGPDRINMHGRGRGDFPSPAVGFAGTCRPFGRATGTGRGVRRQPALGFGAGTAIGARRGPPAWGIGGGNPQVIAWWTVNAGSIRGDLMLGVDDVLRVVS